MMKEYKTVSSAGEAELIINKSRFIGRAWRVSSEAEALSLLESTRKQHWDATHNCFAYRIGQSFSPARFSDDGEPGGTAGKPIMDVLTARALTDTLIIVTRYFGGVLLGAGGLVRAYSKSASQAVAAAGELIMRPAVRVSLTLAYPQYSQLEKYLDSALFAVDKQYADAVTVTGTVSALGLPAFTAETVRRTDGRVTPEVAGETYMEIKI